MKTFLLFLLVVGAAAGGYYCYHTYLSASFLDKEKMEIKGKEYQIWPEEARKHVGITVRRIPNKDNAAVLYVEASNAFREPDGDDAVAWVGHNEGCLRLVHRAVRRPKCEFPIFGSDHTSVYGIVVPFLSPLRAFSALLASEGERYEKRGQYGKALECYFDITPICGHLCESNAILITRLTGLACQAIRDRAVEECLSGPGPDEDGMRAVIKHYTAACKRCPSFLDAVKYEQWALESMLDAMIADPSVARKFLSNPLGAGGQIAPEVVIQAIGQRGSEMRQDLGRSFDRLAQWGAMPAWTALRPENSFEAYLNGLPDSGLVSKMWLPALVGARKKFAWSEAQARGVLIFAAIKLYEKKNGRPPATLSELQGKYLSSLPKDPFSGRDFVYKVRGSEWILYSVWHNLTDDGGVGSWPHKASQDKDCVWLSTPIPLEAR